MTNEIIIGKWRNAHAITVISALVLSFLLDNFYVFMSAGTISFFVFILINLKSLKEMKPFGGYANRVTFLRNSLTLILGFLSFHLSDYQIVSCAIVIILLDGVDGYLARRFKHESLFGVNFDIETDAFYVAMMSLILYNSEFLGFWIIIPGFLRYFYVVVLRLSGLYRLKEKRLKFTQVIAVLYFFGLLSPFILPYKVYFPLLVFLSILIVISFLYSFYSVINLRQYED